MQTHQTCLLSARAASEGLAGAGAVLGPWAAAWPAWHGLRCRGTRGSAQPCRCCRQGANKRSFKKNCQRKVNTNTNSQIHRIVWVWRNLQHRLLPMTCPGQGQLPLGHVAQCPIQLGLEHRDRAPTASLSNLFWSLTILCGVKGFLVASNTNLPSSSLKPAPLLLSLSSL